MNPKAVAFQNSIPTGLRQPRVATRRAVAGRRRRNELPWAGGHNPFGIGSSCKLQPKAPPEAAFSLIELMVTVALLTVIVLGLLAMFTQTKRAFTSTMTQTDVLESGRAVMEMLARDIEQMTPSQAPYLNNGTYLSTNFFAEIDPNFIKPLLQALPGSADRRTNVVQRFFFLTEANQVWTGTGYQVLMDDPNTGKVGTLFRASATNTSRAGAALLSGYFRNAFGPNSALTNLNRIADGIVHLRLRPFATNGFPVTLAPQLSGPQFQLGPGPNPSLAGVRNTFAYWDIHNNLTDQLDCYFMSNAVPAYLELELGILEPRVLERYRSMAGNPQAQVQYLSNHVAQVHLFRQRIPVRNVDFAAYQ